jgi:TolB protein
MSEGGFSHLFAYHPQGVPFYRLTSGDWDDVAPSVSPDGTRVAFASNRDGFWDLYLLDLTSGETTRLTSSKEYDSAPSWSPDGRWLAYESYLPDNGGGLDIYIRPLDGSAPPIRLTEDPAADFNPAWSPGGRQVAFVSDRSGENEIWLADLNRTEGRFQNLSSNSRNVEDHPAWSPDGRQLVWSATTDSGTHDLYLWRLDAGLDPLSRPQMLGDGDWPVWAPDGGSILAALQTPNRNYLSAYAPPAGRLALAPIPLLAPLTGLSWSQAGLSAQMLQSFALVSDTTSTPVWQPGLTPLADVPAGRQRLVEIPDVQAPNALLQDMVDESFNGLRRTAARLAGWDLLTNLQNAFVPLTSPLEPGMLEDWLYTGRAFAFNTLPINAGWLAVVREDFGSQTFWRVYLKARYQDGSQGEPLRARPWDFSARSGGDPRAYEAGGALAEKIPPGYWIDFTRQASAYGWERLPAMLTWRSSYDAARFNEFVLTDGIDWQSAMLEIYPAQALITPTYLVPTTSLPSLTPRPTRTPLPPRLRVPTRTLTPTRKIGSILPLASVS